MNIKTKKPKYFGPKTEKPIAKITKTAKPKIPMPPSYTAKLYVSLTMMNAFEMRGV